MLIYALSAIVSPYLISVFIEHFGPASMFIMIAWVHIILILFGIFRLRKRKTPEVKTSYRYLPRTTFTFARILSKTSKLLWTLVVVAAVEAEVEVEEAEVVEIFKSFK